MKKIIKKLLLLTHETVYTANLKLNIHHNKANCTICMFSFPYSFNVQPSYLITPGVYHDVTANSRSPGRLRHRLRAAIPGNLRFQLPFCQWLPSTSTQTTTLLSNFFTFLSLFSFGVLRDSSARSSYFLKGNEPCICVIGQYIRHVSKSVLVQLFIVFFTFFLLLSFKSETRR